MKIIKPVLKYLITLILALLIFLAGLIYIFECGPSPSIRDMFVSTVMQTSAAKFTAYMFLDEETVGAIIAENEIDDWDVEADTSLVTGEPEAEDFDINGLYIEDVKGATYNGKVMIVNDPSRLYVYALPKFGVPRGKTVSQMVKENDDVVAGVNGGGFEDPNGTGLGGTPIGLVISEGVHRYGNLSAKHRVIGFDEDNKLVVGTMTGYEAIERGVRDAVEWGPALIVNGEALNVGASGGGYNPRTAIGQRSDGAVILVVIDGRRPDSLGASYNDLQDILLSYGAVNAANLDGGLSTTMSCEGETVNNIYSLYGERPIPTGILVRSVKDEE